MLQQHIRNVAIIAHVDHGKTTLVDQLLRATGAYRAGQAAPDRVLDSNDQERERGITILAKNISIGWRDVKINVIDTPGHADFGGEVERVLKMADGALLLVDAAEGPMPQTRFVLRHAIDAGLAIMVVINKVDRDGADPERALNDSLDLMMDLGASDGQLEFAMEHVVYASATQGWASLSLGTGGAGAGAANAAGPSSRDGGPGADAGPGLASGGAAAPRGTAGTGADAADGASGGAAGAATQGVADGAAGSRGLSVGDAAAAAARAVAHDPSVQAQGVGPHGGEGFPHKEGLGSADAPSGNAPAANVAPGDVATAVPDGDMRPLLDMIVDALPAPDVEPDSPLALQVVTVDHSSYVGRIGIGRVWSGTARAGERVAVVKNDGARAEAQVKQLFTFDYLGRVECAAVEAGDIAAVVGIDGCDIGDVLTDPDAPVALPPIEIDPPTMAVVFSASTSPLVGRDGDIVGGRQLKERLMAEAENNVTMRIEELEDRSGVEVAGRGILHLSVLMETMRREGYEFQVGRPRVLFARGEGGERLEPVEQAVVECPGAYAGKVIEAFGEVGGTMTEMAAGEVVTHLEFRVPTRGVVGLKTRILNVTHGEGVFYHTFLEYGPYAGELGGRANGAMVSMTTERAVAYALGTLQERGTLFVGPGDECYEGMLVGERPRPDDMVVNVARTKALGNQRSSTADIAVQLTPPRTFTLEEALEYIADDELVEVTPAHVRMRKRLLTEGERRKWNVRHGLVGK